MDAHSEMENLENAHLELLISKEEIRNKIAEAAIQLDAQYAGRQITIVMIMKGSICLVADLIRQFHCPCSIEFIQAASYGARGTSSGELKITGLEQLDLASKDVLVIDDIYDSGKTLVEVMHRVKQKHPHSLKSLVLLSKKVPRESAYVPDFVLFDIENLFVVGYGLDYKELYRGLPGVYALHLEKK